MIRYDRTITVTSAGRRRALASSGVIKAVTPTTGSRASADPVFVSIPARDAPPTEVARPERVQSTTEVKRSVPAAARTVIERPRFNRDTGTTELAFGNGGGYNSGSPAVNTPGGVNINADSNIIQPVLAEYINDEQFSGQPNVTLNRIYWDIYYSDATCGSTVDMLAKLPFSEFSITGLRDEKALRPFIESCENIQALKLLPEATVEHFVAGRHTGALCFSETKGEFTGYVAFDADHVHAKNVLNYGDDPIIAVEAHPSQREALESTEPVFVAARERLNPDLIERLKKRECVLQPDELIYIPRRTRTQDFMGVSYYRRVLPVWFIEKALMRGTLDSSYKRQKAIRHITAGDGEEWIPTSDEMTAIANLFLKAEIDPLSSIVVTREGINVNELGSPDAFWRWDQNFDQFATIKMRGMAVNEAFITGEANYATLEQTLSVFIEWIRQFRQGMTQEFFYDKFFPRIAYANNMLARRYGRETAMAAGNSGARFQRNALMGHVGGSRLSTELGFVSSSGALNGGTVGGAPGFDTRNIDLTRYVNPKVHWHKRLMPEADAAYFDILNTLKQNGVQVPLAMMAAAGGLDINALLEEKPDDIKLAAEMKDWAKQVVPFNPEAEAMGGGGGGGFEFSSTPDGFLLARPRKSMAQRLTTETADTDRTAFTERDSQGNRRLMTRAGRDIIENRFMRRAAEALASVARLSNHHAKADFAAYKEQK